MLNYRSSLTLFALLLASTAALGETYELWLKPAPGVAKIERGEIDAAIRQLDRASVAGRGELLTNLCVALVLKRDLERAQEVCTDAIDKETRPGIAHNNRGVLHLLKGDFAAAQADFSKAAQRTQYPMPGSFFERRSLAEHREVARRNLERSEKHWAAVRERSADDPRQINAASRS